MNVNCPHCENDIDVTDKLPDLACEENDIECDCGATLYVGWFAEAEIRYSKPAPEGGDK